MDFSLSNTKVLFIGQVFYDYHTKIIQELQNKGADVTFVQNKFHGDAEVSASDIVGQFRKFVSPLTKRLYADNILNSIKGKQFDYLFCIGGFSVTPYLISEINKLNPKIKSVIYFWDSFKTWDYSSLLPLFDKVFSFDPKDALGFDRVVYLPLFYTDDYNCDKSVVKDIDLLYIGSVLMLSRNRLDILSKVNTYALENNLKTFIWLYNGEASRSALGKLQSLVKKVIVADFKSYLQEISATDKGFLKNEVLSRTEIIELMKRAKCIIDIPIPNQEGLTIRTIETLALNNKLITTNTQIMSEPFYDDSYINVIDERLIDLKLDFIQSKRPFTVDISHLKLKNWISTIFEF